MMLTIIKTVKAQVRGLPTRLEIFKIHLAIRGYRSLILGMLANVDAGKTTLSEALLYQTGAIRALGRVDHRDAFLDTEGYRSLIHKIPSRPQKTEYVKQMRPLRFKGRLL